MRRYLLAIALACPLILAACAPNTPPVEEAPSPVPPTDPPAATAILSIESPAATVAPATAAPDEIEMETPMSDTPTSGSANADVEFVRAVQDAGGTWTFHVTVRHPDTGWEDYADGWDVVAPDGTVLKPSSRSPAARAGSPSRRG
jgi:hypothetical protein